VAQIKFNSPQVGEKLREIREDILRISEEEMGERLSKALRRKKGFSHSTISKYEKGRVPDALILIKYSELSKKPIDWILCSKLEDEFIDPEYRHGGLWLKLPLIHEREIEIIKKFLKLFDVPEECPVRDTISEQVNVLENISNKVYEFLQPKKKGKKSTGNPKIVVLESPHSTSVTE